jgi:hypothetical protein
VLWKLLMQSEPKETTIQQRAWWALARAALSRGRPWLALGYLVRGAALRS